MPADLVHHTGNWVTEHPYASAGIAVGALVILYLMFSGSSSTQAPAVSTDNTGAAASVVAAQIAANTALAQTNAAANVTNNQTSAAETVALAQTQGAVDAAVATAASATAVAQFNSSAEIASSNASIINTFTNASAAEQLSNNATLQSEYSSLADTLSSFFTGSSAFANVSNQASSTITSAGTAAGPQPISPASYLYAALGGPWVPIPYGDATAAVPATSNVSSSSTPVQNPNLVVASQSFMSSFGALLAGMGKGLQAPVSTNLSETGILSALQLNVSAVNGWSAHA